MKVINNNICKWFAIIVIPVSVIWAGIVINKAAIEKQHVIDKTITLTELNDSHTSVLVERYITEIIENLKVVRDANEFKAFLSTPSKSTRNDVVKLFVRIMKNKAGYDQIRFLSAEGEEVIRVDNNNGTHIIPDNKLQNKSDRYYFANTIKLHDNEVYISPLDLNIEHGKVDFPNKPTLRFSTPVYNHNRQLFGVLIINHKAEDFIDLIKNNQNIETFAPFEFYILNKEGQFIVHPEQDKSFSFMFEDTQDLSFQKNHQALWDEIVDNHGIGHSLTNHHINSYYDILAKSNADHHSGDQRWILLHSIDAAKLLSWKTILTKLFLTSSVIILLVIILLAYLLAYIIDRLRLTDQQLEITKQIADSTNDAVVITDKETRITYANKAYQDSTGYQLSELIGLKTRLLQSGKHDEDFYRNMWNSINEFGHWEGMLWDRNKEGLLSPKKLKIIAVKNKKNEEVERYVGIFSDLSSGKNKSDSFDMLRHQDGQIIIPNETMMLELLDQSVKNKDFSFTIVYIAIENFNRVISLFNEDANRVSEVFISVIRPLIKKGDVVAQTGRNLFAVIIGMNHIETAAEEFIKNFHKELSKVINIDGQDIFFKTRVGVSYWPQDTNDIKKLLLNSMVALEWTSRREESDIAFFNESMIAELNRENEIEGQLRKAIENNELSIVYQPQVDILSEKIIGMEALVRWHNPALGHVSPALFIPIAEKNNLMIDIGTWIIQRVCADITKMKAYDCIIERKLRCAINISVIQMEEADFVNKFFGWVEENNIQSHEIEFEITESSLLTNEKKNIEILKKVRAKGITVAIDDFGTGYSSLSYLNTLPIDKIKIDRSFIKNYPECDDGILAKILVNMSKTLKMKVLTEGAETKEQVDYLRSIDCDYIQGYYYSKPLPLDKFIAFVQQN